MPDRDFDVVLYGASGFTGKQTVEYFARVIQPGQLRWAIAGRNQEKLEAVKASLGEAIRDVEILVADSRDQAALDRMISRTRVLLTTAGPYALYGSGLVDACVRFKTHYVDITGETVWVRDLIDRHDTQAAADGTRIIPFCGFDSVPSDLGSYLIARHIQQNLGVPCRSVKAFYRMMGGFNGGTMATMFNLYESGQAARAGDLFLLNPPGEHSREEIERSQDPFLPEYDEDIGGWIAPFMMGPINTRVVRRSVALYDRWQSGYGANFAYQEYTKFGGGLGAIEASLLSLGSLAFGGIMQTPLRALLKSFVPKPGEGPSEKTMNEGWFKCELVGTAEDGRKVRGLIQDQGDPGNRATVKFLCESALCLALEQDRLPGGPARGGILTPATGLGDVLADRLRGAGMIVEIGK